MTRIHNNSIRVLSFDEETINELKRQPGLYTNLVNFLLSFTLRIFSWNTKLISLMLYLNR